MAFLKIILMCLNMWLASLPGKALQEIFGLLQALHVTSNEYLSQQGANLGSAKYTTDLLTF